ncbi:MAG: metal-dependent hydrolase [Planctomycetaceae bacterium]|nr:metal-dependent hydrolase [Planctomycetaceae bacterium]
MANHQQHTTFSSLSGLVFGTLAWYPCGFPAVTCLLAGGLCSVGGMLPDIDIKTSRSYHDCMSITACITAMLVILRVSTMGVSAEMISIIGAAVFIAVKFGIGSLIKAFTVHRGMIHSIPFAILCGEILFLTTAGDMSSRILKAAGLSLGFFSHLLLDELYSVDVVKLNAKKSLGTALKFGMRKNVKLTVIVYFLLFCATFVSFKEPNMVSEALDHALDQIAELTIRGTQQFEEASLTAQQRLRSGASFTGVPRPGMNPMPHSQLTPANAEMHVGNGQETPERPTRDYEIPSLPPIMTAMGNSHLPVRQVANPPADSQVAIPRPLLRDEQPTPASTSASPVVRPDITSQPVLARPPL